MFRSSIAIKNIYFFVLSFYERLKNLKLHFNQKKLIMTPIYFEKMIYFINHMYQNYIKRNINFIAIKYFYKT